MLNMKYEYECFICTYFSRLRKVDFLRIFNTYKIFHRAIATYKDGKKYVKDAVNGRENTLIFCIFALGRRLL